MTQPQMYYHFSGPKLRDGSAIPPIGEWLEVTGQIEPCVRGLHASAHPFDALQWAPGSLLHRVQLGDLRIPHGDPIDKYVSDRRMIVATINVEEMLWEYARKCALSVIHLWDAPEVVKQYLTTADSSLRAAAWDAAWDAARAAARAAAWAAHRKMLAELVDAAFVAQEVGK